MFTPPGTVISSSLFRPKGSPANPTKLEHYLHIAFFPDDWKCEDGQRLMAAVMELCRTVGGANVAAAIKASKFRYPIRKTDPENPKLPKGVTTDINMKSGQDYPPRIVDRNMNPTLDPNEIYPGCRVRASVSLFSYTAGKSPIPGVSIGLNNVQKIDDGPRLAGARGDGSEFGGAGGLAPPDEDDFANLT